MDKMNKPLMDENKMNYAELRAIAETALGLNLPLEVETLIDERLATHIATFSPEFVLGLLDIAELHALRNEALSWRGSIAMRDAGDCCTPGAVRSNVGGG